MAWTRDPAEHARRLAICAECEHAVLTIIGSCASCRRRAVVTGHDDAGLSCKHCGGEIRGKEVARCGACGCPLATRKYATCPKGKW